MEQDEQGYRVLRVRHIQSGVSELTRIERTKWLHEGSNYITVAGLPFKVN